MGNNIRIQSIHFLTIIIIDVSQATDLIEENVVNFARLMNGGRKEWVVKGKKESMKD